MIIFDFRKLFSMLRAPFKPAAVQSATSMFDFSTKADRKEAAVFLDIVWEGLEYLCEQVEQVEKERAKSLGLNFAGTDFGSSPGDGMVCNFFLWYANALYNFIGVFQKAFSLTENLEDEFANVILWRNKVAAHTAWASQLKRKKADNAATQDMSIILFPEFNFKFDGHFEVGGVRSGSATGQLIMPSIWPPTLGSAVTEGSSLTEGASPIEEVSSSLEWEWGLVRTHERLKEIVSKYAVTTTGSHEARKAAATSTEKASGSSS